MGSFFMSKSSFSTEVKILVLQHLEEGRYTIKEICQKFSVQQSTLALYQFGGVAALIRPKKNKIYSKELKQCAIEDYLTGKYSKYDLLAKYGISSTSVFNRWLKNYTSHRGLQDSGKGMSQTMTKGRKTTVEERIEIAKACLTNEKNYLETAAKYKYLTNKCTNGYVSLKMVVKKLFKIAVGE